MRETMKPPVLFVLIAVAMLSACTDGGPTTPSAPSPRSSPTPQPPAPGPQSNLQFGVALVIVSRNPAVNEPTTFIAAASAPANASLDFGDGEHVVFDLTGSTTLKHTYSRGGAFSATLTATNAVGASASVQTTLVVQ
jgi:hypothetical protein